MSKKQCLRFVIIPNIVHFMLTILIVVPSGSTNRVTRRSTFNFSSRHCIEIGNAAPLKKINSFSICATNKSHVYETYDFVPLDGNIINLFHRRVYRL